MIPWRSMCIGRPLVVALLCAATGAGSARADPTRPLQVARKALASLRYADAQAALEEARRGGGLARAELLEILAMSAEVTAVLDGPEAGELAFRRLLVLDPAHPGPARKTPVFQEPFRSARAWVRTAGSLRVEHARPSPRPHRPIGVAIQVVADPLAMVSAIRVRHRTSGTAEPAETTSEGLRATLPPAPPGATVEYSIDVLDRDRNLLLSLGGPPTPYRINVGPDLDVKEAPSRASPLEGPEADRIRPRRSWYVPAAIGSGGLLVAGAVVDVLAAREYESLEDRCAPACPSGEVSTFRTERTIATVLYVGAAAGAAATLVLWLLR